jgi:hypothetical protein
MNSRPGVTATVAMASLLILGLIGLFLLAQLSVA